MFATLGGEAVLRSAVGTRRVAADAFVLDIMTTALADDEMLTELRVQLPDPAVRMGFYEVSRRAGDYAMAMAFVMLRRDGDVVVDARIGVGGAERRPRRIASAEAMLHGTAWGDPAIDRAADAAAAAIDPMEDLQVSAGLRRDLVRTCVRRGAEAGSMRESEHWVGRAIRRKEDAALVAGQGCYTADVAAPRHVRFVRSPVASGRIVSITAPPGAVMFAAADLVGVARLQPMIDKFGYVPITQSVLADGVVRYCGEPVCGRGRGVRRGGRGLGRAGRR